MKLSFAAALALFAAGPAFASNVTIDFENAAAYSFQPVADNYSGLGATFTGDALGLVNDGLGSGANGEYFTHAPSPIGVMFAAGSGAAMDGYQGARFYDFISFFYSSSEAIRDAVQVLDDFGNVLASINLAANATDGCTDSAFCNWTQVTANFNGAGRVVTFGSSYVGGTTLAAFDNISTNVVPEPSSVLLAGLALGAAFLTRRRAV
jgi:hypothetical protein